VLAINGAPRTDPVPCKSAPFSVALKLQELTENFGEDHAQAAWDAGAAAIDEIERIVQREEIECEFARAPAYLHVCVDGFSRKEISSLKRETALVARLEFDTTFLKCVPIRDFLTFKQITGANTEITDANTRVSQ
jgi:hypothetical protein